ncbi:MAG TPA: pseudouridine synthase [Alcanivoracaceae bacterium]|nr:pseudouridine synthase [Alcanivoracaceae bacterium]
MSEAPYYIVPPCHEPLVELYVDSDLLVVDKPAFLLSVPGRGPENRDSAQYRLEQRYDEVHVVHRLDLDTSGIMVFARHQTAQRRLNRAFAERRVEKTYLAELDGKLSPDTGFITYPIAPDWERRPRQKICYEEGKASITQYQVEAYDAARNVTRVKLEPITGRSHQLRLHTQHIGHAIIGCDLYASPEVLAKSPRLQLHAYYLGFNHPSTGLWQDFYAPLAF